MARKKNLGGATRGPNPSELPPGPVREAQKKYLDKVEQAGKPSKLTPQPKAKSKPKPRTTMPKSKPTGKPKPKLEQLLPPRPDSPMEEVEKGRAGYDFPLDPLAAAFGPKYKKPKELPIARFGTRPKKDERYPEYMGEQFQTFRPVNISTGGKVKYRKIGGKVINGNDILKLIYDK